ncbi:uncharacterized protein K441DRAFT_650097 [Cenococcum geophilum 1.58]|uniref:uncharacterized protein n=1 Tax=Cenococcum geophilum 1.58 TaxID=794803 RepID=UPI00358F08CA|nr:hypothetical protein K441DRAFT_650097 [Cenococcum geophilum 1.58]
MGWWWKNSDGPSENDAVSKLDPALRQFLDKEAPVKYTPSSPPDSYSPQSPLAQTPQPIQVVHKPPSEDDSNPKVPSESLFPDGRYAHLWKTYEPQSVIESRGKSDQERLSDIVGVYNDRKASVGRIALENCALEQLAVSECFTYGSWASRATLCRTENRAFDRCYDMQKKFLKALGYLNIVDRSVEEEEKIQIHADKLYRRMIEQEEIMQKAKKEGRPIPEFPSVMSKENIFAAVNGRPLITDPEGPSTPSCEHTSTIWEGVAESTRKEYEKRLENLSPIERAVEERAIEGELAATRAYSKQIEAEFIKERIHRLQRKEEGRETIGDTIKGWWGW